jgi:ABC-2 type transport system permease protein
VIIAARLLRDRLRALLWWSAGLAALVLLTVAFYPALRDQGAALDDLVSRIPEAFKTAIGYDARIPLTSPAGYLNGRLFSILGPVLCLVYAIGLGAQAVGGLEEAGQMEPLLSNPVTRGRVAVERYAASVTLLGILVSVLAVALIVLSAPFGVLEGVRIAALVGACAAVGCLALLHGTIAFAVGAATGRRTPAVATATVVAVAGYVVHSMEAVSRPMKLFRFVNPWHWYMERNMLVHGAPLEAILAPVAITALLLAAGCLAFRRRDLR